MEVYLVGGAVRDERLGLPVTERDWCVVGTTPDEMLSQGYKPVGKDFPVFLHPQSGEEYALARTERKTGSGYHGFSFHTAPDVSIEDDLARRDLTVNAMAVDSDDQLIDPFGGMADIEARQLRHVSDAFQEDPVRILRVAKFAARFHELGFAVAPPTLELMKTMVESGEADALVADRVWKEMQAALLGPDPQFFFETLRASGSLAVVLPEVDALFGVPQPPKWHPEIDCGIHAMMVVEQAARLSDAGEIRFAALVHDLGKATTDKARLPSHIGHERRSVNIIKKLAQRLPVPTAYRDLALLVAEYHSHAHRAFELKPATILKVLERVDGFRRPDRFEQFLTACEADSRGRTGFEGRDYPQAGLLRDAFAAANRVDAASFADGSRGGAEIGACVQRERLQAISAFRKTVVQEPNV